MAGLDKVRPSSSSDSLEVAALDLPPGSVLDAPLTRAAGTPSTSRRISPRRTTAERILHPPPVLTEDPFAEERELWSETAGWLRRVTTLREPDGLKAIKPTRGVQAEIRVNLKHARTYVAHLERLRRGGRL